MKKKHILFLFCDQFRYDCIGENGNPHIQTPNLDALRRESICFDRAYTPSPVCVPARLSMLAGQYPARTGCNQNNRFRIYDGEGFYSTLTKAGFNSLCIGKMHNTCDMYGSIGFRARCTQEELSSNDDDYTAYIRKNYPNVFDYNGQRTEMYYVPQVSQLPAEGHPTQWIGDRSVEFIENADTDSENIFLMSSFIHPHPPFCPPAPWNKLYRAYDTTIPPFIPEGFDREEYAGMMHGNFATSKLQLSEFDVLRLRNFYYACVSFVDYQVGRIVDALKKKGIYDDTVIIFSTDHGEMLGDYQNMGKRTMFSPASRIPFMIKVPGMEHEVRHDVASLIDIAPTLLSMFGIDYDKAEFDGIDLFGGEAEKREFVYSQYSTGANGAYMVASKDDKLVLDGHGRYYYFKGVPEVRDEYDPENPRCKQLKELLDAYYKSDAALYDERLAPKKKKKKVLQPFGVERLDHGVRRKEELARIPDQYKVDLDKGYGIPWPDEDNILPPD